MQFSEAQFSDLAGAGHRDFLLRAREYLARIQPDWGGNGQMLQGFIDAGLRRATALDIRTEIDVIRFLELLWRLGPSRWSAEQAWIHEYLGEKRPAGERLEVVLERLQVEGKVPT